MESGYEFDALSELPSFPQAYAPMEYYYPYAVTPLESLPPFPHSDFTPHGGFITFSDTNQQQQQHFTDSSLSLLTRDYLTESTPFEDFLPFLHLPDLRSLEHKTAVEDTKSPPCLSLAPPPPLPVAAKHDDEDMEQRRVGSLHKRTFANSLASSSSQGIHSSRKVSDRIRSLEKLMPWEKKMSFASILEETHKYITFLHSQIASLRWMPLESVYPTKPLEQEVGETNSLLKSLTRQQLLQVIANSPGSRNVLYTQGVCLFSYEQLLSVKMMAESARNL